MKNEVLMGKKTKNFEKKRDGKKARRKRKTRRF